MSETEKKPDSYTSHLLMSDEEILALGVRPCDVEVFRRRKYTAAFAIDTWYESLKHLSFKTSTLPLSFQQAKDIISVHSQRQLPKSSEKFYNYRPGVNVQDLVLPPSLNQLAEQLDEVMKRDYPNGCFVKLNTRSPKDVPLWDYENKVVKSTLLEEISKLNPSERTGNNETIAFIKACSKSLKVENGREAVELLLLSDRVYADLSRDVQFGEDLYEMKIIIREWVDEMYENPQMEFRCFVHKTQLNAIGQYFHVVHFPELVRRKEELIERMKRFFRDEVQPNLTHSSYVVDLFVSKDKISIIELNPFHNGAGAGLFSWSENRELFMNGPLEFRIVNSEKELGEDPREFITPYWEKLIKSTFHAEEDEENSFPFLFFGTVVLMGLSVLASNLLK